MNNYNEIWEKVKEFETYSVSTLGNIRNDSTGRILSPSKNKDGYFQVGLYKHRIQTAFLVHRLVAQAFIENLENKSCVDHKDGNKSNNNIINLRWATSEQNGRNRKMSSRNTSGVKGVYWKKDVNKWRAQIYINGKSTNLGSYNTIEEATDARQTKANEIFSEFVHECEKI